MGCGAERPLLTPFAVRRVVQGGRPISLEHGHEICIRWGGSRGCGRRRHWGADRETDVGTCGQRNVAVGNLAGQRRREEVDARGLLVTPAFVDIHTHCDGHAVLDRRRTPSSQHGVMMAVLGSCGVGFAPVCAADRD